jgi:pimeloyl-ACP methyl ester carboxylesterase
MKTLVMIPAFGCDGTMYADVIEALPPGFKVLLHVAVRDSFAAMVEDVLAKAPEDFIILGTSMGGRLALEVTLAAPERVEGLVIIGAGAGPTADPASGLKRSARLRSGEMEGVLAEMGAMIAHAPGPNGPATREAFMAMGHKTGAKVMARQSDALAAREDRWPELEEIECPVLCLWGEDDQFSPAADGLRLAEAVVEGCFVALPECGHFPTMEYPEDTSRLINDWLEDYEF